MKVAIKTMGCKANRFESDKVSESLKKLGVTIVNEQESADYFILNSCSITHVADSKGRQSIRSFKEQNPHSKTIAFGCGVRAPEKLYEEVRELDVICKETDDVINYLKEESQFNRLNCNSGNKNEQNPDARKERTRALIKIQDGCNNFCSFCIVPITRGGQISYSREKILDEVKEKLNQGYKELVITGIVTGTWQEKEHKFEDLLHEILEFPQLERLRLSSLEPEHFRDRFIDLFNHPKFCKHLHLCLQSGSDEILKKMRRRYDIALYREIVSKLKNKCPEIGINTDLIVGFPGETEDDFNQSLNICREMEFSKIHVFKYSKRKGTQASMLANQVDYGTKCKRSAIALNLEKELRKKFALRFLNKVEPVLFENEKDGIYSGYTSNYIRVFLKDKSQENLKNKVKNVLLEEINNDLSICGTII